MFCCAKGPTILIYFLLVTVAASTSVFGTLTIDTMYVRTGPYNSTYYPSPAFSGLTFVGGADHYVLNDGSQWSSGAGSHISHSGRLASYAISGNTIHYYLTIMPGDFVYQQTDYDSGNHSAQGELTAAQQIEIVATIGSSVAVSEGFMRLYSNNETWYGQPRFNYYSAPVGALVPFQFEYTLFDGATWTPQVFDNQFKYRGTGYVDFKNAIPEPSSIGMLLGGGLLAGRKRSRSFTCCSKARY